MLAPARTVALSPRLMLVCIACGDDGTGAAGHHPCNFSEPIDATDPHAVLGLRFAARKPGHDAADAAARLQ